MSQEPGSLAASVDGAPADEDVTDAPTGDGVSELASVGGDKQVFFWDVASGRVLRSRRTGSGRWGPLRPDGWSRADEVVWS